MTGSPRCFVIGLGNMGAAIGERLASTGADVVGVDMSADARGVFEAATACPTFERWDPATASPGDRVMILVRTPAQARAVLQELDESGLELIAYVMTTLDVVAARELADAGRGAVRVVEAPLSGGRSGAIDGSLTMMIAGPVTDDDRAFLLGHIAGHVVDFEHYGQPNAAKLHNNVLAAYHARAHAEVLLVGERNGIDIERLDQVLNHSSGASWMGEHLAVVVDDLLDKDVALFAESFGAPPAITIGADSDLAAALATARERLTGPDTDRARTRPDGSTHAG
ncbi:MAG: NAD(P)-binding domain-containing protein [Ilumatobacteraceae bacterium]|nr:NAD(P)-binding domain-containing protein [Ilumatobacteraceae bacterium]